MAWRALAGSICLLFAGCGGDDIDFDDDKTSVGAPDPIGTVQGVDLDARDVIGIVDSFEYQSTKYSTLRIALADRGGICSMASEHTMPGDTVTLGLEVQTHDLASQPPPIAAGRYDLGVGIDDQGHLREVVARFSATDDECREQIEGTGLADEGTITVDEVSEDRARGSFTLRFGADALNGDFDAPLCPLELPFQATCTDAGI